eukprot:Sdes_comp18270_c0_seq2m7909
MAVFSDSISNSSEKINHFCERAKNLNGSQLCALLVEAINTPGVFSFGEFFELANVQQLQGTSNQKYFDLLSLFSVGTYSDYEVNKSRYMEISPYALEKLKILTIATLAASKKSVPYSELLFALGVNNIRNLEDLIIEAIYSDVIIAKLDQKNQLLLVEYSQSRDLKHGRLETMIGVVTSWADVCQKAMHNLHQNCEYIRAEKRIHESEHRKMETTIASIQSKLEKEIVSPNRQPRNSRSSDYPDVTTQDPGKFKSSKP